MKERFHIVITDEDGNVFGDYETNMLALVYAADGGVGAATLGKADIESLFQIAVTMDYTRNGLLRRSPLLAFLYKFRRKIIKNVMTVDTGLLSEALKRREEMEDDDV